jgi:hypothetical protein
MAVQRGGVNPLAADTGYRLLPSQCRWDTEDDDLLDPGEAGDPALNLSGV